MPDATMGAVIPINQHGTNIYLTAAQVHAENVYGQVGFAAFAMLLAGMILMPKRDIESTARWYGFRIRWNPDDPKLLFSFSLVIGILAGCWFYVMELPRLVT